MKKIQPIKIVVAVVTALVFCIALAVPCFADEIDQQPTDYIYKRVYSYDELISYFNFDQLEAYCIVREYMDTNTFFTGEVYYYPSSGEINVYWHYVAPDAVTNYELHITDNSDTFEFIVREVPLEGEASSSSYELTWPQFELYVLVPDPSSPSTDSGWFGDIKNIIGDAIFGENASLDNSQQFTLNQISLWLTVIVILLPLIVVGVILVRCFR